VRRTPHPSSNGSNTHREPDHTLETLRHNSSATKPTTGVSECSFTLNTFKGESQPSAPITSSRSYASLAPAFLADFCADDDMLAIVRFHDETLSRQVASKMKFNQQ
jgi:hypothetical protein